MANGHPLAGRGNDRRIEELDAIRGLMALLVVFYHYSAGLHIIMPDAPTTSWSFAWGEYGVQGFFAVSGFVIFMTLDKTQRASDFAVSRFSRLFPAYWAAMLVTTAVVWLAGPSILHRSAGEFAVNVTMLQSFFGVSNVDESYWTLGLELAFYVLMLLAWRLKLLPHLETIAWLWFALRIGAPLVPALDGALVSVKGLYQIPFFVLGLLAWRVWQRERSFAQLLPLIIAGGLTLWVANLLELVIVYTLVAFMMLLLTDGRLGWLKARAFLWLGAISYPLYLVHQFVGVTLILKLEEQGMAADLAVAIAIVSAIGLAALIHYSVEQPALRAIRARWKAHVTARDARTIHGQFNRGCA